MAERNLTFSRSFWIHGISNTVSCSSGVQATHTDSFACMIMYAQRLLPTSISNTKTRFSVKGLTPWFSYEDTHDNGHRNN